MKDKIVIVTGATSGIGEVTATELARKGARVGIVARNMDKAEKTREQIMRATGDRQIDLFRADFASLPQVKAVASQIISTYSHIDVLVNNAGLTMSNTREISPEGYELTITINHLSPFLLTALLFHKIRLSTEARIIHLSSAAHAMARPDFSDFHISRNYSGLSAYSISKLYNIMFTRELARRLQSYPHITTNAVHPGVVASGFASGASGGFATLLKLMRPFMISSEKGAETTLYLASSPDAVKFNGLYFKKKKPATVRNGFANEANNRRLWTISEEATGVSFL